MVNHATICDDDIGEDDLGRMVRKLKREKEGTVSLGDHLLPATSVCGREGSVYTHVFWDWGTRRHVVQCVRKGKVEWTWTREWEEYEYRPRDPLAAVSNRLIALVRPDRGNRVVFFDPKKGFVAQAAFARLPGAEWEEEDLPLTVEEEFRRSRATAYYPRDWAKMSERDVAQTEAQLRAYSRTVVKERLEKLAKEDEWLKATHRHDFSLDGISSLYAMADGSLVAVGFSRQRAAWFTMDGEIVAQWPDTPPQDGNETPTGAADDARIPAQPYIIGAGWDALMMYMPEEHLVRLVDRHGAVLAEMSMLDPKSATSRQKKALKGFGEYARGFQIDSDTFAVMAGGPILVLKLGEVAANADEGRPPIDVTIIENDGPAIPPKAGE